MSDVVCDLTRKHCVPCEGGVPPMSEAEAKRLVKELSGWELLEGKHIVRDFKFSDFHETMDFVDTVASLSNSEGHHPVLEVTYNTCKVVYWTHAIGGLSENDFICAAKVNRLVR